MTRDHRRQGHGPPVSWPTSTDAVFGIEKMIGDHHGRTAGMATLLVRAVDGILGTHRRKATVMRAEIVTARRDPSSQRHVNERSSRRRSSGPEPL